MMNMRGRPLVDAMSAQTAPVNPLAGIEKMAVDAMEAYEQALDRAARLKETADNLTNEAAMLNKRLDELERDLRDGFGDLSTVNEWVNEIEESCAHARSRIGRLNQTAQPARP